MELKISKDLARRMMEIMNSESGISVIHDVYSRLNCKKINIMYRGSMLATLTVSFCNDIPNLNKPTVRSYCTESDVNALKAYAKEVCTNFIIDTQLKVADNSMLHIFLMLHNDEFQFHVFNVLYSDREFVVYKQEVLKQSTIYDCNFACQPLAPNTVRDLLSQKVFKEMLHDAANPIGSFVKATTVIDTYGCIVRFPEYVLSKRLSYNSINLDRDGLFQITVECDYLSEELRPEDLQFMLSTDHRDEFNLVHKGIVHDTDTTYIYTELNQI